MSVTTNTKQEVVPRRVPIKTATQTPFPFLLFRTHPKWFEPVEDEHTKEEQKWAKI